MLKDLLTRYPASMEGKLSSWMKTLWKTNLQFITLHVNLTPNDDDSCLPKRKRMSNPRYPELQHRTEKPSRSKNLSTATNSNGVPSSTPLQETPQALNEEEIDPLAILLDIIHGPSSVEEDPPENILASVERSEDVAGRAIVKLWRKIKAQRIENGNLYAHQQEKVHVPRKEFDDAYRTILHLRVEVDRVLKWFKSIDCDADNSSNISAMKLTGIGLAGHRCEIVRFQVEDFSGGPSSSSDLAPGKYFVLKDLVRLAYGDENLVRVANSAVKTRKFISTNTIHRKIFSVSSCNVVQEYVNDLQLKRVSVVTLIPITDIHFFLGTIQKSNYDFKWLLD